MRDEAPAPSRNGSLDASLRGLVNDLRDASDSTILRVTQAVDTLPVRGEADRLLEALRPRLATLRPPRPRTLRRVLFASLDPVIVANRDWRPGSAAIPRGVLAPILALIREHMPGWEAAEASLAEGHAPEGRLWREAASILADQPMPAEWGLPGFQTQTGINVQAMRPLLAVIRLAFAHAAVLRLCAREVASQPIRPLLPEAARSGPLAWNIVLALLFEYTLAPAALIGDVLALARETKVARQLEGGLQNVMEAVIDRLDGDTPQSAGAGSACLGDEALHAQARRAARLASFSALRGDMQPFAGRLAPHRRQMAALCSAQLKAGLRGAPEACVPPGSPPRGAENETAERLEMRLRALRRLDLAARPLGNAEDREQVLAEAASFYAGADAPDWLTRADRLRLCEILVGAEAALRLTKA